MPRSSPYNAEVAELIVADYRRGKSTHELVGIYGGNRRTLSRYLKRASVPMRTALERQHRIPCREDAFANAECDAEAAYWVGMLMADGCVSETNHSTYVILTLGVRDEKHVESFRSFLNSQHKILHAQESRSGDVLRGATRNYRVASKRMATDLARYGIVPRKSKTAEVIILESNRHFWRGVVDGDGSLGWNTRKNPAHSARPVLQVVGSERLMRQFETFARFVTGTRAVAHRAHGCWGFSLSSGAAIEMISYLYTNCTIALQRKWELAHQLICAWQMRLHGHAISGHRKGRQI